MQEISVQELKQWQDSGKDFQLIDVREENEYDFVNIGGVLIPLGGILDNADQIAKDKDVVIHCKSGRRSATAIQALSTHLGFNNLYNLKGGILAYASEIDPSLPKY